MPPFGIHRHRRAVSRARRALQLLQLVRTLRQALGARRLRLSRGRDSEDPAKGAGERRKPHFFDGQSPVSMLVFEKMLGNGGTIEEMLPTPEQWVMGERGDFAGEFVIEF